MENLVDPILEIKKASAFYEDYNYIAAAECAGRAVAVAPHWATAASTQALALAMASQFEEAATILSNYLEGLTDLSILINGNQSEFNIFCNTLAISGLNSEADALLTLAIESTPDDHVRLTQLAKLKESLGDFPAARRLRARLAHAGGATPELLNDLAFWPKQAPRPVAPSADDPFAHLELNAWEASPEDIVRVADAHGVALVRGLISPAWIAQAHAVTQCAFLARDVQAKHESVVAIQDYRTKFEHETIRAIELGNNCPDSMVMNDVKLSDIFCNAYFWRIVRLMSNRWPSLVLAPEARWSDPEGRYALPFHQDSHDASDRRVNIWIPLQDCGVDSPGLSFAPFRMDRVEERVVSDKTIYAQMGFEIPEDHVKAEFGDMIWSPRYRAGDVAIFHSLTIHKTDVRPGMTKPRLSLEARYI